MSCTTCDGECRVLRIRGGVEWPEECPDCACRTCHGLGMVEHRAYVTRSPYDTDRECPGCMGTGRRK